MFYEMILPVLVFLAVLLGLNALGYRLAFTVPALRQTRQQNQAVDAGKMELPKYQKTINRSQKMALALNLVFLLGIAPFVFTLQTLPWWRHLVDFVAVLMLYDFFYYVVHRYLFHGNGYLRRVHGIHHQARQPTAIDGHYVHPVETLIGLGMFHVSVLLYGLLIVPEGIHAVTGGLIALVYLTLNVINHVAIDLPFAPFRTLHWVAAKHKVHHENMHKGNYATITLLYDKLFGTLD